MCFPGSPKSDKVLPSAGSPYPVSNSAPSQAARETRRESSQMRAGVATSAIWDASPRHLRATACACRRRRVPPMYRGRAWRRADRWAKLAPEQGRRLRRRPGPTAGSSTSVSKTSPSQAARETRHKPRQVRAGGAPGGTWRGLWRVSRARVRRRRRGRRVRMYVYRGGGAAKTAFFRKTCVSQGRQNLTKSSQARAPPTQ